MDKIPKSAVNWRKIASRSPEPAIINLACGTSLAISGMARRKYSNLLTLLKRAAVAMTGYPLFSRTEETSSVSLSGGILIPTLITIVLLAAGL